MAIESAVMRRVMRELSCAGKRPGRPLRSGASSIVFCSAIRVCVSFLNMRCYTITLGASRYIVFGEIQVQKMEVMRIYVRPLVFGGRACGVQTDKFPAMCRVRDGHLIWG